MGQHGSRKTAPALLTAVLILLGLQTGKVRADNEQIQQQVDQYVDRPTGEQLIVKSAPAPQKHPKKRRRAADRDRGKPNR